MLPLPLAHFLVWSILFSAFRPVLRWIAEDSRAIYPLFVAWMWDLILFLFGCYRRVGTSKNTVVGLLWMTSAKGSPFKLHLMKGGLLVFESEGRKTVPHGSWTAGTAPKKREYLYLLFDCKARKQKLESREPWKLQKTAKAQYDGDGLSATVANWSVF